MREDISIPDVADLTPEQLDRFWRFVTGDDLDFYEEYTIHLSDEEQEKFFEDNPDFMSEFPVSRDKMYLLRDKSEETKKKKKRILGISCASVMVLVLIFFSVKIINNNSVNHKILGQWTTDNGEATWNFEFRDDDSGQFIGYTEGSNTAAINYSFIWSYSKENEEVTIKNIVTGEKQNGFKLISISNDKIEAEFSTKEEKELRKSTFDYDGIVSEYGSYYDENTNNTKQYFESGSEPQIGMDETDVKLSSWGRPKKINKTTSKGGISEQWVYDNNKYIYLEDGIVTSIQE